MQPDEFMNGLRPNMFHSCANNGADDENRKGGRSTLIDTSVNNVSTFIIAVFKT